MAHPKQFTKRARRRKLTTVLAGRARQRLRLLSKISIGRKAVHEFTGLDEKTIRQIKNGSTRYCKKETRDLIFSVPFNAHCDHALVNSDRSRWIINKLGSQLDMGFTKSDIAIRLGGKIRKGFGHLEVGRKKMVTARSQMRIEKLYRAAKAA